MHEFQTQKILHTNLLYTARPPRVPSPLPPEQMYRGQASARRGSSVLCFLILRTSLLHTPQYTPSPTLRAEVQRCPQDKTRVYYACYVYNFTFDNEILKKLPKNYLRMLAA